MDAQLDRFYRAWLAPEATILGYHLTQPWCLGHRLMLQAIGSPFVRLGDPLTEIAPADLLIALKICAEARWPFRFASASPDARNLAKLSRNEALFAGAVEAFATWIGECSGQPEFWQDESEEKNTGDRLTAPDILAQAASLLRKTTFTEERVFTMSLGLVTWYSGAIAEQEGAGVRFFYDGDADEANNSPDLSLKSEEELLEIVTRDMGPEFAAKWLAARKEAAAACP